ncbi:MAG: TIGR01841 family phasin [Holosporaceae bacterium]|jgi:phasin family protein|nr:TIGR01841 family phasin [Holosporaceae bacterium]
MANPGANEKSESFAKSKIPNIDTEAVMNSYKKNLEILGLVNKMSVEICSGVAKLQGAFVKQILNDLGNVAKSSEPSEAFGKFSELTHGHFMKAIENSKQISEMINSTHGDLTNAITKRLKESMEEAKNIVKK